MSGTTKTILIVEDEHKLAQLLLEYMKEAGYQAYCLHDGDQVIPWLSSHHADLLILDLMLPGKHGDILCQEIRTYSDIPIIMATARVEEADRLTGLEIGADDYLCKPYSLREMVARVKVILRRMDSNSTQSVSQQQLNKLFDINPAKMSISVNAHQLDLTPVEFRLLEHFITSPNIVFSRDDLMNVIYNDYRLVSERTVDSHIKNLRKKIHRYLPDREFIKSIYGIGYIFTAEISSH